jgi:peroxiredoxin
MRAEIEEAGGALAAISVDAPEDSAKLAKRLADDGGPLGFPLLCDPSGEATRAFGVFDAEHDIALPAIVILGRDRRVAWKYIGESVPDRPPEREIVHALDRIRAGAAAQ